MEVLRASEDAIPTIQQSLDQLPLHRNLEKKEGTSVHSTDEMPESMTLAIGQFKFKFKFDLDFRRLQEKQERAQRLLQSITGCGVVMPTKLLGRILSRHNLFSVLYRTYELLYRQSDLLSMEREGDDGDLGEVKDGKEEVASEAGEQQGNSRIREPSPIDVASLRDLREGIGTLLHDMDQGRSAGEDKDEDEDEEDIEVRHQTQALLHIIRDPISLLCWRVEVRVCVDWTVHDRPTRSIAEELQKAGERLGEVYVLHIHISHISITDYKNTQFILTSTMLHLTL